MKEKKWFYELDGHAKGPVTIDVLENKFENGELHRRSLLRSDRKQKWVPAYRIEELAGIIVEPAAHTFQKDASIEENIHQNKIAYPYGRPWVRFIAKMIDINICVVTFGIILALVIPGFLETVSTFLFSSIMIFFAIVIDVFLLPTWGTTPGRWLMKTHIQDANGNKLRFQTAFKRSLTLWIRGFGLGSPILSFFTQIISYTDLTSTRTTPWDSKNNLVVLHDRVGFLRSGIAIVISLLVVYLNLLERLPVI